MDVQRIAVPLPYGLSLYYADRFDEGAQQFRKDVAVNPNDTEVLATHTCIRVDTPRRHVYEAT